MSGSSFTTLASDDRSESIDSVMSGGVALNNKGGSTSMVTKSGSLVMSMSLAQFYLGQEDMAEEDDFGQDNPFVKEHGLDDRKHLSQRKQAIQDAASLATKKAEAHPHRGQLEKQLSATQFTMSHVKGEFNKRQDASAKAFKPAILQALEERKSESDGKRAAESDEAPAPVKSEPKIKEKRPSSVWRSVKVALGLAAAAKTTSKRLNNPKHEEHGW